MLDLLIVIVRGLALAFRGHRELVLENLALRQQLMTLKRTTRRAHLGTRDRLFWIAFARLRRRRRRVFSNGACRCAVRTDRRLDVQLFVAGVVCARGPSVAAI